ncbi:hypothetical protein PHISCL_11136 [Aspergillus sclerotialis]|uniref:Uncharacterized protein n=1 Tax=Aspergillus sclerotialis TaxID=2070753 RepID=A0A3A2Z577_9EURO|nr:hypothetical protein PHISCL_11136 [Aspergillus sclerotialis]
MVVASGRRDCGAGLGSNVIDGAGRRHVDLRFSQLGVVEEEGGLSGSFLLKGHSADFAASAPTPVSQR